MWLSLPSHIDIGADVSVFNLKEIQLAVLFAVKIKLNCINVPKMNIGEITQKFNISDPV